MDTTSENTSCLNSTDDMDAFHVNVYFATFLPVLIIAITILNLATIVAFWKLPSLREKPSELFILNLSCADLITGLVFLPIAAPVYITPGYWPTGEDGCIVTIATLNMGVHGSLFALTTISVDRFLLVYMDYPKYINTITRGRVVKVIAAGWAFVILTVVIELSLWNLAKEIDESARRIPFDVVCLSPARRVRSFSLTFFLILYFCPVILVCGLSTSFLYQLRKRLQTNKKRQGTLLSASATGQSTDQIKLPSTSYDILTDISERKKLQKHRKTTTPTVNRDRVYRNRYIKPGITLVGLVLAMAFCMLPYCFYVLITESGCERCNNTNVLFGLLLLQFCNACLDSFIYVFTRKKLRQFYTSSFWKLKCLIKTDM